MTYTLRLRSGVIVGRSELEDADRARGVARGRFRPALGYELVQPIFDLYADAVPEHGGPVVDQAALERFEKAREALALELVDGDGTVVAARSIVVRDDGNGLAIEAVIPSEGAEGD